MNAELVAFGVLHHHPVLPSLGEDLDFGGSRINEDFDMLVDGGNTIVVVDFRAATGVHIEVDIIARYLARLAAAGYPSPAAVDEVKLEKPDAAAEDGALGEAGLLGGGEQRPAPRERAMQGPG